MLQDVSFHNYVLGSGRRRNCLFDFAFLRALLYTNNVLRKLLPLLPLPSLTTVTTSNTILMAVYQVNLGQPVSIWFLYPRLIPEEK